MVKMSLKGSLLMRSRFTLFATLLPGLLSACTASPLNIDTYPKPEDVTRSYHQQRFQHVIVNPDNQQVSYNLSQEAVVHFSSTPLKAVNTLSSPYYLQQGTAPAEAAKGLPQTPGVYYIKMNQWENGEIIWMSHPENRPFQQHQIVAWNPVSGSQRTLSFPADQIPVNPRIHNQQMYYQSDNSIYSLSLQEGTSKKLHTVPTDQYQGFSMQTLANEGFILTLSRRDRDRKPEGFRVQFCSAFTLLSDNFRIQCALPPVTDNYLLRKDKQLIALPKAETSYAVEGAQLSPDQRLLSYSDYEHIHILDVQSGQIKHKIAGQYSQWGSPDQLLVQNTQADPATLSLYTSQGEQLAETPLPSMNVLYFHINGDQSQAIAYKEKQLWSITWQQGQFSIREIYTAHEGNLQFYPQANGSLWISHEQIPNQPAKLFTFNANGEMVAKPTHTLASDPIRYNRDRTLWSLEHGGPTQ
jgi:hypothetical protein